MLKQKEDIFDLFLKVQNILRFGVIKDLNPDENIVLVHFADDCELWLKTLSLKAGNSFIHCPLEKEELVFVLSPDGDLSEGVVWGSVPSKNLPKSFLIKTSDFAKIEASQGISLGNGKEDLIALIIEALKIIAGSKTPTSNGLQPSLEASLKLPVIVARMESLQVKGSSFA